MPEVLTSEDADAIKANLSSFAAGMKARRQVADLKERLARFERGENTDPPEPGISISPGTQAVIDRANRAATDAKNLIERTGGREKRRAASLPKIG